MKDDVHAHSLIKRVALVLQGGGALGAYQAGIYQGLQEHGLTPDWVVGTSIGAINAAIIAGNKPDDRVTRLEEFWHGVARYDMFDMKKIPDSVRQFNTWLSSLAVVMRGAPGFFMPRPFSLFASGLQVLPEQASYYDTSELKNTLARLVDFDYLNMVRDMRLTVSAVQVTTGKLRHFDNSRQKIRIEHLMASGALPPGFPGMRVDGDLYWDGGLYSNTPLEIVLDEEPRVDTLCFMVDLWSAKGPEPRTLDEVGTRTKDITFASRSKRHIDAYLQIHALRHTIRALHERLTPEQKKESDLQELAAMGSDSTMHIVHLAYAGRDWNMASKDINFARGSIQWRWDQGYRDVTRALKEACWLEPVAASTGLVVHELAPHRRSTSA